MITKSYSDMIKHKTFKDRFHYLRLNGSVGVETFGFDRIFNQLFYTSKEWRKVRNDIIIRDNASDLGMDGYELTEGNILIHHINPISMTDLDTRSDKLFDPENLICTSRFTTHNAIHYGDETLLPSGPIERRRNDTCPWKH